jgi:septal ring factor EnvC (AmiA/AmiB activator)
MSNEQLTIGELEAELGYLNDRIDTLTQERNSLPRSDKRRAGELLILISQHQAEVRKIRPQLVHLRHEADRKSRHKLWFRAVSEIFGDDAPARCMQWMREERKRLKEQQ